MLPVGSSKSTFGKAKFYTNFIDSYIKLQRFGSAWRILLIVFNPFFLIKRCICEGWNIFGQIGIVKSRPYREENSLRHVALVAKLLNDNEPKIYQKENLHKFKLRRSYLISFNLSKVGEFFLVEFEMTGAWN